MMHQSVSVLKAIKGTRDLRKSKKEKDIEAKIPVQYGTMS